MGKKAGAAGLSAGPSGKRFPFLRSMLHIVSIALDPPEGAPQRMPEPHTAWLVDLDGTLYRAAPVKLSMAVELALGGWSVVPALRRFRAEHERLRAATEPFATNPYEEQLARTAAALGLETDAVERIVTEWMQVRPCRWIRLFRRTKLLDEIRAFKGAGGRTALVSDYPATRKLLALGAQEIFDVVVAAGEQGGPTRLKPDPDGLLRAAERLGVPAARCLVLGDRLDADALAAQAAGMAFRRILS